MDQIVKKRNRVNERPKALRALLKAIARGPIVKVKNSYWSPYSRRLFNGLNTERYAAAHGFVRHVAKLDGQPLLEAFSAPKTTLTPKLVQFLAQERVLVWANRVRTPEIHREHVMVPVSIDLARQCAEHGDLADIVDAALRSLLTPEDNQL